MFFISQRVPNSVEPSGRTDTLQSTRSEPSSIFPSDDAGRHEYRPQLVDIVTGLVGAAHIGRRNDLDQGHTGPVVVDE